MNETAGLLAAALAYAAADVHVFPVRVTIADNGSKKVAPIGKWREASTTSADTIRGWWARGSAWADASIAIDCGKSGLVVVDLDGEEGMYNWSELKMPTTSWAATPGGGEHWYYAENPRRVVGIDSSGKVAPNVDVRGLGGFVIAPPSTDGRGAYRWLEGAPGWPELPTVPDLVADRMNARDDQRKQPESAAEPRSGTPGGYGDPFDDSERRFTREQAEAFVRPHFEALRSAPVGTINSRLNDAAVVLGHFVPAMWSRADAERFLTTALGHTAYDGATWRAAPTIASGLNTPGWRAVLVEHSEGDAPPAGDQEAEWVRENLPRLDWHALWADDNEEEWIVEPLLPARRLVALYSAPKVGKSLLMLELAVGVARGTSVLGTTPGEPRRVLYVDFENDPKGDIRERLTAMGCGPDDLENLFYLSFPRLAVLDSERGGRELLAAVQTYSCDLVVVDTVSRAVSGLENDNDTWLAFYRHTGKLLKAAGVALVRLDHTGKDETRGQRGGSAKSGDVDAVWRMSKMSETTFRLDCEAHRMPVAEKTLTLHREPLPHLHHRVDALGGIAAWEAKVGAVIAALDSVGLPASAGRVEARKALKATGETAGNKALEEAVRVRKERAGGAT